MMMAVSALLGDDAARSAMPHAADSQPRDAASHSIILAREIYAGAYVLRSERSTAPLLPLSRRAAYRAYDNTMLNKMKISIYAATILKRLANLPEGRSRPGR